MTPSIEREYRRLRDLGWAGLQALHAARTRVEFHELENQGLVRFKVEPDECSTAEDLLPTEYSKKEQVEFLELAKRDGIWGIVGEYLCPTCPTCKRGGSEWIQADSVWGFIGDDVSDNGYDTDVMQSTINELREAQTRTRAA